MDILKQWIQRTEQNARDLEVLLSHVHWEVIPSEYIVSEIVNDPVLTQGSGAKPIMAAMSHHLSRTKLITENLRNRRTAQKAMLIIGGAANQKSPVCVAADGRHFDFDLPSDALPFFNRLQGNIIVLTNEKMY